MKKRFLSCFLAVMMLFSCFPWSTLDVLAEELNTPAISVDGQYAAAGSNVQVELKITNNPGIAGALLTLSYDPKLTLIGAESEDGVFSVLDFTNPGVFTSPCNFNWDSESAVATEDGTFLKLNFTISEEAKPDEELPISVTYRQGDIYDGNLNSIDLSVVNGKVVVIDYIPGDVNSDGVVNGKDVTLIRRYNAGGYGITINEYAADVNDDDMINGKDVTLIRRYNAGGYGVVLKPHTVRCVHEMTYVQAVPATCEEDGNDEYWYCAKCGKCYSNAAGTNETSLEDKFLAALGHDVVIDPYEAPDYGKNGWTEGSHCARCLKVLKEREYIEPLTKDEYAIVYDIFGNFNNDSYLKSIAIDNSKNPTSYTSDDGVASLAPLESPDGYTFLGWYNGTGSSATEVFEIPQGKKGTVYLYAKWELETYNIVFDSRLCDVPSQNFTVRSSISTLPNPDPYGYTFMCWVDDDGSIVDRISQGTVPKNGETLTLHARWTSQRNQTMPYSTPIALTPIEDVENGQYIFPFEIGVIQNVPLQTILDLGNGSSLDRTQTKEYNLTITDEQANSVAQTVSSTVSSNRAYTLANNWSESTSVSETQQESTTKEDIQRYESEKESTGKFALSNSNGGSTVTANGITAGIESSIGAHLGTKTCGVDAEIKGSLGTSEETTDTATWNTTGSFETSGSSKTINETTKKVAATIGKERSIGTELVEGHTETVATTEGVDEFKGYEYSSAFTYSTSTSETRTATYQLSNAPSGYYRLVSAGTLYVYAVVIYDIATSTYSIMTYNLLDDETHEFIDYCKTSSLFNDDTPQIDDSVITGIMPFDVPFSVHEYVSSKVAATNGLKVSKETGKITAYNGTSKDVIIPEYITIDNGNGTFKAVKVTGIESGVFANKDITSITFNKNITEIPSEAFKNCSELKTVNIDTVKKIGDDAFNGCTSLEKFEVTSYVDEETHKDILELGENAFVGVKSLVVQPMSAAIAKAAVSSGAKSISLDLSKLTDSFDNNTITIPSGTAYFEFAGGGKTYNNVYIESDADVTEIKEANFVCGNNISLDISSNTVTFNEISVNANGLAVLLSGDNATLRLISTNRISTTSTNAMLCQNIKLVEYAGNSDGKLNITGNMAACSIEGKDLVNVEPEIISSDEYARRLDTHTITFDPNEGNLAEGEKTKSVSFGSNIGALPVPTRDYYTFEGWYTEKDGGTKVDESTPVTSVGEVTYYAHWKLNDTVEALASAVPEDAEYISSRWTYTKTETTESTSSSMSGWTPSGSYWKQTGSGTYYYASFPSGYNTNDSYYKNYAKSALTANEKTSTKREVSSAKWYSYIYWHWCYPLSDDNGNTTDRKITSTYNTFISGGGYSTQWYAFQNPSDARCEDGWYWYPLTGCKGAVSSWWFRFSVYSQTYKDYQKIYQYKKVTNNIESATAVPAGGQISNVQEWVTYRPI